MVFLRAFSSPERCMQRLGFLKPLVWLASHSSTNKLTNLGKEFIASVTKKIPVVLSSDLDDYMKTARVNVTKTGNKSEENENILIEIQDLYLSNPALPSRRGKLIDEDWRKYPILASNLGLLRKDTFSILVRGRSFLAIVNDDEKKAFETPNDKLIEKSSNPFQITLTQRLFLLFMILEGDGDVLRGLYERLIQCEEPFSDREAGSYLPEIYRAIVKDYKPKIRSGDDSLRLQSFLDTANTIEKCLKSKPKAGKDIITINITPRLEPFVDLYLLSKPDPYAYRYHINNTTRIFFESLINSVSIEKFLNNSFLNAANQAYSLNGEHLKDKKIALRFIQKAYTLLKSPLGYAPILEVSLLAGIYALTEKGYFFEISECIDMIKEFQREKPKLVTLNVDRWGKLSLVKFNGDIMKEVDG